MASVELCRVEKAFGKQKIIHALDLTVAAGEFVVLVGPSGCGKSTVLRMIAGLEDLSGGRLTIGGRDAARLSPKERGVAMVFQNYALYPHMSVRDNMSFALALAGVSRAETKARVEETARVLTIEHLLDKKPGHLSGGQKQRVAMGRAMVRRPAVFLFDEPLSNLDAQLRVRMRSEIADLHRRLQATVIYVTHDQVEAMTLATRIAVLRDGRLEQVGAPLDVYARPATRFVASFIGTPPMNFLPLAALPAPTRERLACPAGAVTVGFRPEAAILGPPGGQAVSLASGRVRLVELLGSTAFVHLRGGPDAGGEGGGDEGGVIAEVRAAAAPPMDTSLEISAPASSLFYFDRDGRTLPGSAP